MRRSLPALARSSSSSSSTWGKVLAHKSPADGLEWIDLFRQHSDACGRGSFHKSMGLHRAELPPSRLSQPRACGGAADASTLVAHYAFPARLRSGDGDGDEVCLATVCAVFDEVSTWAFFTADASRRPGVSVHLSAEARWDASSSSWSSNSLPSPSLSLSPSPSGEASGDAGNSSSSSGGGGGGDSGSGGGGGSDFKGDKSFGQREVRPAVVEEPLEIVTTVRKVGRTLGFADVQLVRVRPGNRFSLLASQRRERREVLATGRHVKFLPMPDLAPRLLSWDRVFNQRKARHSRGPDLSSLGALLMRFLIARAESAELAKGASEGAETALRFESVDEWLSGPPSEGGGDIEDRRASEQEECEEGTTTMRMVSLREHCNPLGTTHGGCQLMLAAQVAKTAVRAGSAERAQVVWTLGNSLDLEAAAAPASTDDEERRLRSIQMTFYQAHKKGSLTASAYTLSEQADQEAGALETVDVSVQDTKTGAACVHASLVFA